MTDFDYDPDTVAYVAALVRMVNEASDEDRGCDDAVLWAVTRGLASFEPRVIVMALLLIVYGIADANDHDLEPGIAWAQRELAATREGLPHD